MNTQQLIRSLRNKVTKREQDKRKHRRGVLPVVYPARLRENLSHLISRTVVEPIVKAVNEGRERNVSFQFGTSTGFYYLLVRQRRFAVLYVPNPASGQIFIKFLNVHGAQCTDTKVLNDTNQIVDYLDDFDNQA